ADLSSVPFPKGAYDFVYCLGVLHHLPDPEQGLRECVSYLRRGGAFLVYLYYDLEGRSFTYRTAFRAISLLRAVISRLPFGLRNTACDAAAVSFYVPLAFAARTLARFG